MVDNDFIALQSKKKNCPVTTTITKHGPPCTPEDIAPVDVFHHFIDTDWMGVQPLQPNGIDPSTIPPWSLSGLTHDDVPLGAKCAEGGFRQRQRSMQRGSGTLPPLVQPVALDKNVESKCKAAWHTETYVVLNDVRDQICAFAGFIPLIESFASNTNACCYYYWDKNDDAFTKNWGEHKLWLNPPFSRLQEVVDKIFNDTASGILIVPVWPSKTWFHLLGLIAITWWDLPEDKPIFMTEGGTTLRPSTSWRTRAVIFDAFGADLNDVITFTNWLTFTDNGMYGQHNQASVQ